MKKYNNHFLRYCYENGIDDLSLLQEEFDEGIDADFMNDETFLMHFPFPPSITSEQDKASEQDV